MIDFAEPLAGGTCEPLLVGPSSMAPDACASSNIQRFPLLASGVSPVQPPWEGGD